MIGVGIVKKQKCIGKILKTVYDKIHSDDFKEGAKMHEKDFTRNRKLNFSETVLFILSGTKKSLQSALYAFFKEMKIQEESYTKQAFSKGRQRIKPEAFLELFTTITNEFYTTVETRKYKGYRVSAIDGTRYSLPNSKELEKKYGIQKTANQVQALGSCLYDVLNGMLLDVQLSSHNANERKLAEIHLEALKNIETDKELILMDRGYPSADLFRKIDEKGFKFVARSEPNFIKSIPLSSNDCTVKHKFKSGITCNLRVVKFELNNGKEEIILTNLFDEEYTSEDFKYIYHLRWGIEEKYDDLKNKLQIENFSGATDIAILQDFYATMFLSNLSSIMMFEYADEIEERYNTKELKHKYKANISMTISLLKLNLIEMLATDSDRKRTKIFNLICNRLTACVVPVRDNRSYPRSKTHYSLKFPSNRKQL